MFTCFVLVHLNLRPYQVYSIKWDFSHLDEALQSGSLLPNEHSEKTSIYCFGCTEPQMIPVNDTTTVVPIPVIVAVQTDIPLPEKLGLNSVQMESEKIVDMHRFKMGWMPLTVPKPKSQGAAAGAITKRRRTSAPRVWGLCCSQVLALCPCMATLRLGSQRQSNAPCSRHIP